MPRILNDSKYSNYFYRTGEYFGISVTGFMGTNCESYMEFHQRNNSYTFIRSLINYRIINMENEEGKEILNTLLNDSSLNRDIIANEILNENKRTDYEIINKINDKLYDDNPMPDSLENIAKLCNKEIKVNSRKISTKQRQNIIKLLENQFIEEITLNEKPIVIISDNAQIHHANDVEIACKLLNIELIFLSPYCPDLNPIEDLWRVIKKELYLANYNCLNELMELFEELFYENVYNTSFYENWLNDYML